MKHKKIFQLYLFIATKLFYTVFKTEFNERLKQREYSQIFLTIIRSLPALFHSSFNSLFLSYKFKTSINFQLEVVIIDFKHASLHHPAKIDHSDWDILTTNITSVDETDSYNSTHQSVSMF